MLGTAQVFLGSASRNTKNVRLMSTTQCLALSLMHYVSFANAPLAYELTCKIQCSPSLVKRELSLGLNRGIDRVSASHYL